MRILIVSGILMPLAYLSIVYNPLMLDHNPPAYSIPFPAFEGPLEQNNLLSQAEILFEGELRGPESIVFYKGDLYTGLEDGRIVKVKDGKVITVAQTGRYCEMPYEERQCGRPLGMRIGKDGLLYVIDAYYGIFTMNFTTGTLTRVLPSNVLVDGEKLNFPDDLDIDDEGNIYFTDASKKWDLATIYYMMMEYESGGRVIKYNMQTGETQVLMKDLRFPNGVQLSKDKKSLLVNELMNRRILRYHIKGPKKGKVEVFADNLPAEPDNIRPSPRGYWVAFTSARNSTKSLHFDTMNSYPHMKRMWVRIHHSIGTMMWSLAELIGHPVLKTLAYKFRRGDIIVNLIPRHGIVIEFDENGKMLRSLHSPGGKISALSEVKEHEGYLYLGSFTNHYLGRLKL